jgi:Flp pilus assembly protein TadD
LTRQEQIALGKSRTINPKAYEAYLKGRYYWNKRTGEGLKKAIEYFREAIEVDPSDAAAYSGLADSYELGQAYEQQHRHDDAIAEFQKAIELSGHRPAFDSNLAYAYAVSGRKQAALGIIKDLEARHDQDPAADANIALIYVGLGDHDEAMTRLNKAYEERFNPSILLRPTFDSLRSDDRFKDLQKRIGLP